MNCPQCGNSYAPGNRFCGNCGYNLADAAAEPVAAQSSAEPTASDAPAAPDLPPPPEPPEHYGEQPLPPGPPGIVCPRCSHTNEADSAYCFSCGLPLFSVPGRQEGPLLPAFEWGSPGGFWLRVAAYLIDTLVIVLPVVFLWVLLGQPAPEDFSQILEPPAGYERLQIVLIVLTLVYDTALITLWATTVGKRAFGLYVVRSDGSRVGLLRALARHVITALSANLTLGFVFLVVAFRADRRGLHDILCDTVVIRRYRQQPPERPYPDNR